jgi:predicted esterase
MKKVYYALLFSTIFHFSVSAQQIAKSIPSTLGGNIGFYEYKPPTYDPNGTKTYPLIIFLHGKGERGNGTTQLDYVLRQGIPLEIVQGANMTFRNPSGQEETFLVLSPQSRMTLNNVEVDEWLTKDIDDIVKYAKTLRVDLNRIYLTGLSMGGGGVWSYASSSPENAKQFAAIAPVYGTYTYKNDQLCPTIGASKMGVWVFHNEDDNVVPSWNSTNALAILDACPAAIPPKRTINATGGHFIWQTIYKTVDNMYSPNLYEWFLSNTRSTQTQTEAPIANAGSDKTITLPTSSVTVTGLGSSYPGGTIVQYLWQKIQGPSQFNIVSPSSAETVINSLVEGVYLFKLSVTDNQQAISSDTVKVTVNAASQGRTVTIYTISPNNTVAAGTNYTYLEYSGVNDATPIKTYFWQKESGPAEGTILHNDWNGTYITNLVAGNYIFSLKVTDTAGKTGKGTIAINLVGPTAKIITSSWNNTVTLPQENNTYLDGSGSTPTPGSKIASYNWSKETGPNGFTIYNPTWSGTNINLREAGTYKFVLTVTDSLQVTDTAQITIYVGNASSTNQINGNVVTERTDVISQDRLNIYPNPVIGNINLNIYSGVTGNGMLRVFDSHGRMVYSSKFIKDTPLLQQQINIPNLSSGMYNVEIVIDSKKKLVTKFLKK